MKKLSYLYIYKFQPVYTSLIVKKLSQFYYKFKLPKLKFYIIYKQFLVKNKKILSIFILLKFLFYFISL